MSFGYPTKGMQGAFKKKKRIYSGVFSSALYIPNMKLKKLSENSFVSARSIWNFKSSNNNNNNNFNRLLVVFGNSSSQGQPNRSFHLKCIRSFHLWNLRALKTALVCLHKFSRYKVSSFSKVSHHESISIPSTLSKACIHHIYTFKQNDQRAE